MDWMRARADKHQPLQCPQCRAAIDVARIVAIDDDAAAAAAKDAKDAKDVVDDVDDDDADAAKPCKWTKVEMLQRILARCLCKQGGRALVFSGVDGTFDQVKAALGERGIAYAEAKGNTSQMMHMMRDFRDGRVKVVLLNTHFAGSGIDLSCATDVVIMHAMGLAKVQAVGRANRVGRTAPLAVHNLVYQVETNVLQ